MSEILVLVVDYEARGCHLLELTTRWHCQCCIG